MPQPGPFTKKIAARYYARFGEWPPGLILVLGADPIPVDLTEAAQRLRKVWLRVEAEKELREELDPPRPKTVKWVNENSDVVSISGFEPRPWEMEGDEPV
jgi:hypothetical protein